MSTLGSYRATDQSVTYQTIYDQSVTNQTIYDQSETNQTIYDQSVTNQTIPCVPKKTAFLFDS